MGLYSHMLNQPIKAAKSNGFDKYSRRSFDADVEIKARVELVNKTKMTASGELVPITARVWIEPDLLYDAGDRITYREIEYKVIGRKDVPDGTGKTRLVELECNEWQ